MYIPHKKMNVLCTARQLVSVYQDVRWVVGVGAAWCDAWRANPVTGPAMVEMIADFRSCVPLVHPEPVWGTECDWDHEEWCVILPPAVWRPCEPP